MSSIPKKTIMVIGGVVIVLVLFFVLLFSCIIPGLNSCSVGPQKITADLTMWGVGDTPDTYKDIIANFGKSYPEVKVVYRSFSNENEYGNALLEALATNQGPDIFEVKNNQISEQYNKIAPLPSSVLPLIQIQNLFPRTVEENFAPQGTVYAIPLSIDTLALIYNRRLIDQAAVTVPATWEDFKDVIPKLSNIGSDKKITQAAIALGGSEKNVSHATDILSLLMLQSGTQIVSSDFKSATFATEEGTNALNFYTQFTNARTPYYTWSTSMPNSLDSFGAERTAMIIDYASAVPLIRSKNAFLDIGIAPVPQPKAGIDRPIAYGSYWGYTVSKQSKNQDIAWRFVTAMTTNEVNADLYAQKTGKPPALSSLLKGKYLNDPKLSVFARQALIARSWPEINARKITQIFSDMIDAVNANQATAQMAISTAEDQVTQLMSHTAF